MKPILIHIHMYYPQLWSELRAVVERVGALGVGYRLVMTMVEEHPGVAAEVTGLSPGAEVRLVPNRGYDIAPFLELLGGVNLDDFSYVLKLHTKRNVEQDMVSLCVAAPFNMNGSRWREALLAFTRPGNLERCLLEFEQNPRCGMVAHHLVVCPRVTRRDKEQFQTWQKAEQMVQDLGLPLPPNQHFVMGSMFACRAALLKPLQKLRLQAEDFEAPDPEHLEETLAHVLERCLGAVVTAQGYMICDCFSPRWDYVRERLQLLGQQVAHFLFARKVTRKGKLIVKVCKVPVYYADAKAKK